MMAGRDVGYARRCAICREGFRRERPAGELALTVPVASRLLKESTRICMA
jgi:hypothetical protein